MKNRNPFFTNAAIGFVVTLVMHIVAAFIFNLSALNNVFFMLYAVFAVIILCNVSNHDDKGKKLKPIRIRVKK